MVLHNIEYHYKTITIKNFFISIHENILYVYLLQTKSTFSTTLTRLLHPVSLLNLRFVKMHQ